MDNHTGGGYTNNNDGGLETRKFFLNCLCLLLGCLDSKRFEITVFEFGMNISRILVPQFETKSEIREACTQVLFSAIYHLRSAVLPYASDLLRMALKALRKESDKERMAGAKLIRSLMASEYMILENISVGLLQERSVLSTISSSDPSPELQQLCRKLLACISSP